MGDATPGQFVFCCIRKQAEHRAGEQAKEQHSSLACDSDSASRVHPEFLPSVPSVMNCGLGDVNKPFPSQVDMGQSVLSQQLKENNKT